MPVTTLPRPARPKFKQQTMPGSDLAPIEFAALFKIGIGPSSSHTMGPMVAARRFVGSLLSVNRPVARLSATAYGSLAWTGSGHATDKAFVLGLASHRPEELDPDDIPLILAAIERSGQLVLPGGHTIRFDPATDILFDTKTKFAFHPNAMSFCAFDHAGQSVAEDVWYSVGGGFVVREGTQDAPSDRVVRFRYSTAADLLAICQAEGLSIAEIVLANERVGGAEGKIEARVDEIAEAMFDCIDRGLRQVGVLPGGLRVRRRAAGIHRQLTGRAVRNNAAPHIVLDHVSSFAIAVNEENASGGRVVTAPTNGAAGVIPAVLRYFRDFCDGADAPGIRTFLLTATAIGGIIKRNASISGAEVGCQGEVGSASAMAAAGLAAALGGSARQVENAAEIAMEHHLGMTCDPIGGLVQIPCIERNAFGAVKAINAASLALRGDGEHVVSLDQVVETMRQTGRDMKTKYRETSRGGLAINVPNC